MPITLINCPACGKEVSEHAETCPHCGHPLVDEEESEFVYEHMYTARPEKPRGLSEGSDFGNWLRLLFGGILFLMLLAGVAGSLNGQSWAPTQEAFGKYSVWGMSWTHTDGRPARAYLSIAPYGSVYSLLSEGWLDVLPGGSDIFAGNRHGPFFYRNLTETTAQLSISDDKAKPYAIFFTWTSAGAGTFRMYRGSADVFPEEWLVLTGNFTFYQTVPVGETADLRVERPRISAVDGKAVMEIQLQKNDSLNPDTWQPQPATVSTDGNGKLTISADLENDVTFYRLEIVK